MTNPTKNVPKPPTKPKPPKYRTLIFAIIAIFSAFFVVLAITWYNYHFGETVARIEINGSNVDLTSRGIDSYLSEDGSYIRILPNGEIARVWVNAYVFNHEGQRRGVLMHNHDRIISWEVDGVPPRFNNETNETIPWEQEHYNLMRNATGSFRINLANEYREIKIRVSSTRNANIYDIFTIIIDPNMTPTLPAEPSPTAETPTPTPTPAPIPETEISQFLPTELEVFKILGHLRDLEMAVWDVQSALFNPIVADEDYWRALERMNHIDNNFWNNFYVLDRILRDFPIMEEEWRWLQDLGTIYINLFAVAFETLHGLPPEYHAAALQTPASAAVRIRSIISELQALLMQNPNIRNADLLAEYIHLLDIENRLRQANIIPIFTPNGVLSGRFINAYESGFFADLEREIAEILGNLTLNVEEIRHVIDRYFSVTGDIFHATESELWNPDGNLIVARLYATADFRMWLTISENEIRQALLEE